MSWRCPACGYSPSQDVSPDAKALMNERPEPLQKLIKHVIKQIDQYCYKNKMPKKFINQFMYSIALIEDNDTIFKGIRLFLEKQFYKSNRNLAYLSGIIKNLHLTRSSQIEAELRLLGTNPPEITKETKNVKLSKQNNKKK